MDDIPDSTDWLNTPLSALADLENALHCQVCKEFYDTPMITSCQHTFCSKCIRTSLSADGQCPACRAKDQASKLRNNWALQEVVATFLIARPEAIKVARQEREEQQAAKSRRSSKRKRAVLDSDDVVEAESGSRATRSKSRRLAAPQSSQPEAIAIDDSDEDETFEPEQPPDDGLVDCPLGCGKRMKIEAAEPHLDRCDEEKEAEKKAKAQKAKPAFGAGRLPSRNASRAQERISQLSYSMMNDTALRKKLRETGIPDSGAKQLLVRRHIEWVNLWNANCDSSEPRTKRALLHDLDTWERTQGGKAPTSNMSSSVMRKDFDGGAWATKNKDDFSRLIAYAKRKKANVESPRDADNKDITHKDTSDGSRTETVHFDTVASKSAQPVMNDEAQAISTLPTATGVMPFPARHSEDKNSAMHLDDIAVRPPDTTFMASLGTPNHEEPPRNPGRKGSNDQRFSPNERGEPCSLSAHLSNSTDIKTMPMFEVPSVPSRE